jgi:Fe-S-cluster-containing dehydrogenase component
MPDPMMESQTTDRRAFLKTAALLAGGAAAGTLAKIVTADAPLPAPPKSDAAAGEEDQLVRMQRDLQRALAKPLEQRRWRMVIDTRKCIGCHACTVACVAENNLPPGVTYRTVHIVEDGDYPNLMRFFMPTNCMQCENPPCVRAANAVIPGAMGIRPDGIVTIDYTKMKGRAVFEAAKKACPYGYALYFDEGGNHTDGTPALQPYEQCASLEYGKRWKRADTVGVTRKCHFCIQRIEAGVLPACVATCTGGAMHFGDANDPASLVSELSAQRDKTFVLNQQAGTKPRNVYLHSDPLNAETSCMKCHEGGNLK